MGKEWQTMGEGGKQETESLPDSLLSILLGSTTLD